MGTPIKPSSSWAHRCSLNIPKAMKPEKHIEKIEDSTEFHPLTTSKIEPPVKDKIYSNQFLEAHAHQTLLTTLAGYYEAAKTKQQRLACLDFILRSQHYNADLTERECKQLGYQKPLCNVQRLPGYFRTEDVRMFSTFVPWIRQYLQNVIQNLSLSDIPENQLIDFIKPASTSAVSIMKMFYASNVHFVTFESLLSKNSHKQLADGRKKAVHLRLTTDDLNKPLSVIIQDRLKKVFPQARLNVFKLKNPDLYFVFELTTPGIDCSLLWVATWHKNKKNNNLWALELKNSHLFKGISSLLNQAGAVPDRLAVNAFVTQHLSQNNYRYAISKLGLTTHWKPTVLMIDQKTAFNEWEERIHSIQNSCVEEDPGVTLIRDAIVHWDRVFFKKFALSHFASPLLTCYVLPWIQEGGTIVEWSKAYQNICEVVMFCLKSFPERFEGLNYESMLFDALEEIGDFSKVRRSVGLFSYGMTPITSIFSTILNNHPPQKTLQVTSISQNYFETLLLLEKMGKDSQISSTKKETLSHIETVPDVLIADIHPNNPAKKTLHQNGIAKWVDEKLKHNPNKHLVLILDITLNNLTDKEIKKTVKKLLPHVESGQLEMYAIQSLAKLIQLGADNFSGGACLYLGPKNASKMTPKFNRTLPEKEAYFSLIGLHFQQLVGRYIDLIRENTKAIYEDLLKSLSSGANTVCVSEDVFDQNFKGKHPRLIDFSAIKLTQNTDENTVYTALSFRPLLDILSLSKKDEELLVKKMRKIFLGLAEIYELPITGRQSFGFNLLGVSEAVDALRLSTGIENETMRKQYIDLITLFSYGLTLYTAKRAAKFDVVEFQNLIHQSVLILRNKRELKPVNVPLYIEDYDEGGCEVQAEIGQASLYSTKGALKMRIQEFGKPEKDIDLNSSSIGVYLSSSPIAYDDMEEIDILDKLVLHLQMENAREFHVNYNIAFGSYEIRNANGTSHHFLDKLEVKVENCGLTVCFKPKFSVTTKEGKTYGVDQIYKTVEGFGAEPVNLSKLDPKTLAKEYNSLVRYDLEAKPIKNKDAIELVCTKRKPHNDYVNDVITLYREGSLQKVVTTINNMDLETLPIPHDYKWHSRKSGKESLEIALRTLGYWIFHHFNEKMVDCVKTITNRELKEAFLEGLLLGIKKESVQANRIPTAETVKCLAQAFSQHEWKDEMSLENTLGRWIEKLKKTSLSMPEDINRVSLFFEAALPLLKRLFATPSDLFEYHKSVPLLSLARALNYTPILDHFASLAQQIPQRIPKMKDGSLISIYAEFITLYPLSDEIRKEILEAISTLPDERKEEWLVRPMFYFYPFDQFEVGMVGTGEETVFDWSDTLLLRTVSDCVQGTIRLPKMLNEGKIDSDDTLRWAVILQEGTLFSSVEKKLKSIDKADEKIVDSLRPYLSHLNLEIDLQNRIHHLINKLGSL